MGPRLSPEVVKGWEQWGRVGQVLQEVVTVSEELQTADWPVGKRGRLCGPERHKLSRLRTSDGTERKHAPTRPQPWSRHLGAGEKDLYVPICPPLTFCGPLHSPWLLGPLPPHLSKGLPSLLAP